MTWDQAGIGGLLVFLVALCAVGKAGRLKSERRSLLNIIAADHFSLTVLLHTRWITATERSCLSNYVIKCGQNRTKLHYRLPLWCTAFFCTQPKSAQTGSSARPETSCQNLQNWQLSWLNWVCSPLVPLWSMFNSVQEQSWPCVKAYPLYGWSVSNKRTIFEPESVDAPTALSPISLEAMWVT